MNKSPNTRTIVEYYILKIVSFLQALNQLSSKCLAHLQFHPNSYLHFVIVRYLDQYVQLNSLQLQ